MVTLNNKSNYRMLYNVKREHKLSSGSPLPNKQDILDYRADPKHYTVIIYIRINCTTEDDHHLTLLLTTRQYTALKQVFQTIFN